MRVRVCSPWYLVQAHHQAGQVEEEEHDDHGDQDLGDVRLLLVHHREPVRSDPNRKLWSLLRYRLKAHLSGPLVYSEVEDCENHEGQNSCCGDRVEKLENQQKSANNKISLKLQDREVDIK